MDPRPLLLKESFINDRFFVLYFPMQTCQKCLWSTISEMIAVNKFTKNCKCIRGYIMWGGFICFHTSLEQNFFIRKPRYRKQTKDVGYIFIKFINNKCFSNKNICTCCPTVIINCYLVLRCSITQFEWLVYSIDFRASFCLHIHSQFKFSWFRKKMDIVIAYNVIEM